MTKQTKNSHHADSASRTKSKQASTEIRNHQRSNTNMKQGLTQIAVVLDRSGSMGTVVNATIDGFNEFISQQKAAPGEARVKLVQFDDIYEELYDKPLKDVEPLTTATFVPRGMTALHDAMGRTIDSLGRELDKATEKPERVVIVILTDGGENASKDYNQAKVANLVKHQQDKYNWTFMFIGANQDAVLTAQTFNIPQNLAMTYNSNATSTRAVYAAASRNVVSARAGVPSRKLAFTKDDRKKARQ